MVVLRHLGRGLLRKCNQRRKLWLLRYLAKALFPPQVKVDDILNWISSLETEEIYTEHSIEEMANRLGKIIAGDKEEKHVIFIWLVYI